MNLAIDCFLCQKKASKNATNIFEGNSLGYY